MDPTEAQPAEWRENQEAMRAEEAVKDKTLPPWQLKQRGRPGHVSQGPHVTFATVNCLVGVTVGSIP